jgi:hypothetical protein
MTFPHQCRCVICGEIGMITPGLPNVFAENLTANVPDTPPGGVERRAIVPEDTRTVGMVPALGAPFPFDDLATCVHGYVRCMICKFPAP